MLLGDVQRSVLSAVAERHHPPIQMPFCLEAAILSRMRARDLALELGKVKQDVQRQPSNAVRRVRPG
jgi:hypothetical protein